MNEVRAEIEHWQRIMPKKHIFTIDSIGDIVVLVSDVTGISVENMFKPTRKGEIVFARQLAQSLAFAFSEERYRNWSLQEIADRTGITNHATVVNSRYTIYNMYHTGFVSYYNGVERNNFQQIEEAFSFAGCDIESIKVKKYMN